MASPRLERNWGRTSGSLLNRFKRTSRHSVLCKEIGQIESKSRFSRRDSEGRRWERASEVYKLVAFEREGGSLFSSTFEQAFVD